MSSRTRSIVLLSLMALAMLLVLVAARSGLGVTPDSVNYVAGASSWSQGLGVLGLDGRPLTLFPPGLPALLGSLAWLGAEAETAALVVNVVCAGLLVLGTYVLARLSQLLRSVSLGAAAVVAVSPALTSTLSMLWTEPVFSVLVVLTLICLMRLWGSDRGAKWSTITLAATLVALATSVRYAGVTLIPAVGVAVWMSSRDHRGRVRRTLVAVVAACFGPGLLLASNWLVTGAAMGERYPGTQTFAQAVQRAVRLWGEYATQASGDVLKLVVGLIVLMLLVIGAIRSLRARSGATVIAAFLAAYWLLIWWSQSTTRIDVVSDRLGFPAFVPTVVLAILGAVVLAKRVQFRFPRAVLWAGIALFGLILIASAGSVVNTAWTAGAAGRGYAEESRETSPLRDVLAALPGEPGVASDDPWQVWWWLRGGPVLPVPASPTQWPQSRTDAELGALVEGVRMGKIGYVVLVSGAEKSLPIRDLENAGLTFTPVASIPEGRVLAVTSGP